MQLPGLELIVCQKASSSCGDRCKYAHLRDKADFNYSDYLQASGNRDFAGLQDARQVARQVDPLETDALGRLVS
jgi:hypothetical protein